MPNAIFAIDQPSAAALHGPAENRAVAPLLEWALTETHAQGAYLYRIAAKQDTITLAAWAGLPAGANGGCILAESAGAAAIVLQENAWTDPRFAAFPQFRQHRFEGVISIPVRLDAGESAILHVCRTRRTPVKATEFGFLQSLALPIATMLRSETEVETLRRKVDNLTERLAARKAVERAKGILQERFQFSEEQAYLSIRRMSRRRRAPMREIAEALIQDSLSQEARHAS
jgi:uroporphyrinogen-III synthase